MAYHGPNTGTRRTFTALQVKESRAAWDAGDFSTEWREWRHLAAMQAGIIAPPIGTKWDSWGDPEPSERAVLIRAIREQPAELRRILTTERVGAWSNVIALLVRGRDRRAEDIERAGRDDDRDRAGEITTRQAADTLRRIGVVLDRRTA